MRTVGLYTLGCKVSQYETEAVAEQFEKYGYTVCPFNQKNDVYVINTCTVTSESDRKSRQVIRRAVSQNPNGVVIVMGCYSQRSAEEVASIAGVSAVIGTENKLSCPDIAQKILGGEDKSITLPIIINTDVFKADFEQMTITRAPRTRAYVKIEDGCDSKCSYCAISMARGRIRSKKKEDVIKEIEILAKAGTREIVLTGIETAAYGKDFSEKYTLAALIRDLSQRNVCKRIRLGSLAPELIDEEFIEAAADSPIFAPHFHISIQSGSDAVLRSMKRRYNSKKAMEIIQKIRSRIPRATFTTDLMVGFPAETEEDFLATMEFVKEARFLDAHVFQYSRREGTPAASYPMQIKENEKRKRSERLISLKNEVRDSVLSGILQSGDVLSVIAETKTGELWSAHSDTYVEVNFPSQCDSLGGEMLNVRPVSHKNGIMYCEIV